jgi:DNA-binding transcriptional MerR regulator
VPRCHQAPGHSSHGGTTISEPTTANEKFDDEDYPAYTMGRAADLLGTTQAFLRSLDEAKLITPQRSAGGHRRYSRYQLRIAARARELVDQGTPLEAACRIIILEDQLTEALERNAASNQDRDGRFEPETARSTAGASLGAAGPSPLSNATTVDIGSAPAHSRPRCR